MKTPKSKAAVRHDPRMWTGKPALCFCKELVPLSCKPEEAFERLNAGEGDLHFCKITLAPLKKGSKWPARAIRKC